MASWIRKETASTTPSEAKFNDYSDAVVQAYASTLTHLSASQIRTILAQTGSITVVQESE